MKLELLNPIFLIAGGVILLVIIFIWNKHNQKSLKQRKQRNFKESYYERKQQREKEIRDNEN